MKITEFQDNNFNKIRLSIAGDGDTRIYIDKQEGNVSVCLKLSRAQANMLIASIIDVMGDYE